LALEVLYISLDILHELSALYFLKELSLLALSTISFFFLGMETLTEDEELKAGQQIKSKNLAYRCIMQVGDHPQMTLRNFV
jgi:hypothetical protein